MSRAATRAGGGDVSVTRVYWKHVHHLDVRARLLADRHYSRQTIGAPEFCPPGNKIVLLGLNDDALWVSHRPDPKAGLELKRMDGYDYFDNSYFRNESGERASDLIRQALAITRFLWQDYDPPDGFHTFVNEAKVRPTIVRGKPVYGWVFQKAGFVLSAERTKERGLLRYVMPLDDYLRIEPLEPVYEQLRLAL